MDNMTIYLLSRNYDYDGSEVIGLFRSLDTAKAEAERLQLRYGDGKLDWHYYVSGGASASLHSGSWSIEKLEVND